MARHYLVTGGAGFIGSNLVRYFVANTDARITVLDKLTYAGRADNLAGLPSDRVELIVGDVADAGLVGELVAQLNPATDAVIHCAAESHNDNSLQNPRPFIDTNIVGAFTVLEAVRASGVRLHHMSTDEVFGDLEIGGTDAFTEASPYRPSSPYSASKASSDMLVRAWIRSFGIRATISACSNNYGPYQHVEKFIPRQITNLIDGVRPRLYGTGEHVRDWIHVDDHSSAILAILERGRLGETYLIGAAGERSNRQVVEEVLEAFGRPATDIDFVNDRPGHDRRYAIDASKLRGELGWAPHHEDFFAGIADTIEWYRAHEEWWRPGKDEIEQAYRSRGY